MKVLVLGKAKTGTTVIAETIVENLQGAKLIMEPKSPAELATRLSSPKKNYVAKIIFEHWGGRPDSLNALVRNEVTEFDKIVLILRDPRDELISRLIYFIFPWSRSNPGNNEKIETWIELIKQKETNPESLSFLDLTHQCEAIFGRNFLSEWDLTAEYAKFLENKPDNSFLLRYEEFMQKDFEALESYLAVKLQQLDISKRFDYTKRTASLNNWKSFLLSEDISYIQTHHGEIIESLGYTDWSIVTPPVLPKEHYSGYIERLLSKPEKFRRMKKFSNFKKIFQGRRFL